MPEYPCQFPTDEFQPGSLPEVFRLIELLDKKLKNIQGQTLRTADLTPPQFVVLRLLVETDEQPIKDLADELHCTRATMTGIIDTMEKKELIKRIPHRSDRRSTLVKLTKKGRILAANSEPQMGLSFSGCCDILTDEETGTLSRLLNKLNQDLNF
jgi:DNA-binding MarR family transcriptional regulator